jgi:hypothetical protein
MSRLDNFGERDSDMISVLSLSNEYVIDFWGVISAWTGFCDTRAIPYDNLVDYLSYAASSSYHSTC